MCGPSEFVPKPVFAAEWFVRLRLPMMSETELIATVRPLLRAPRAMRTVRRSLLVEASCMGSGGKSENSESKQSFWRNPPFDATGMAQAQVRRGKFVRSRRGASFEAVLGRT